ncbi:MAG: peroxiredoxin family protein [Candidatus Tectomicrobia bacterium]|nr:peroxiredoxin family protein [Candidatus Tectomicrobia bacterium]
MCREQLGKLAPRIGELTTEGAAVLGISNDTPEAAARLARELGLTFPILSDVSMEFTRAYRMKGKDMEMAEMGYVVIDKKGRIRTRQIDRRFGENFLMIARALRQAKNQT